jgi:hypothetical protein
MEEMGDFRGFTYIVATTAITPLKESEGQLQ